MVSTNKHQTGKCPYLHTNTHTLNITAAHWPWFWRKWEQEVEGKTVGTNGKGLGKLGLSGFQPSLFLSWGCWPILKPCPRWHLHWNHLSLSLPEGPLIYRIKFKSHSVPWSLSVIVSYPWQLISVPQSLRHPPSHHSVSKGSTANLGWHSFPLNLTPRWVPDLFPHEAFTHTTRERTLSSVAATCHAVLSSSSCPLGG